MTSQKFVLQITEGPDTGMCFGIAGESVLIGRAPECDIRLENARGVSRNHCRVFVMSDGLRVQDLESQNGTIVQGKRIGDAVIKAGVSFKVGDVTFLVQTSEGLSGQFALASGGEAMPAMFAGAAGQLATASSGGGLPAQAQNAGGGLEKAQELMAAAGESSRKMLLQLGVLIGIIVAGLYLLQLVSTNDGFNSVFALVRSYEKKIVNFGKPFASFTVEGRSAQGTPVIHVNDYNGLLKRSLDRLQNNRNAPSRRMMVVQGGSEGDAFVLLRDGAQNPVGRLRIVCRGISPYHLPQEIGQEQARAVAGQELAQAKFFLKDNRLYDAWLHYKRVEELCNGPANDPRIGGDAGVEASRLYSMLSDQLCALFDNAMAAAFPEQVKIRVPDFNESLRVLEEAKNLIPDENSLDRQVIENWIMIVAAYKNASMKKR